MNRIIEVDIIRPIAILLVVFTHCFAIYTGAWNNPNADIVPLVPFYQYFTSFLSSFRMPAVILGAGYIFAYFEEVRPTKFLKLFISKFKRLLIPAFIFGVAYYFLFPERVSENFLFAITSGVGHLWFLPMLFWNFIVGFFLLKIRTRLSSFILLGSLFMFSKTYILIPNLFGVSEGLYFIPYFYLGIILWRERKFIIKNLVNLKIILILISIYVAIFILFETREEWLHCLNSQVFKAIRSIMGSMLKTIGVLMFYLLVMFYLKHTQNPKVSKFLIKSSYGIYVFHQFILLILIYRLNIYEYINYKYAPFIMFAIVLLLSSIITHLFLKTKIGKYLIG